MDIELVTDPYAYMMYIVSPLAGLGGGHIVAASRLQVVIIVYYHYDNTHNLCLTCVVGRMLAPITRALSPLSYQH